MNDNDKKSSLAGQLGGHVDKDDDASNKLSAMAKAGSKDKDDKPGMGAAAAALGSAMAGATLSDADKQALTAQITAIQQQFADLPGRVKLTALSESLGSLETRIKGLPGAIAEVRGRGYPYREYLENKVEVFGTQWDEIKTAIRDWMQSEAAGLEEQLSEVEPLLHRLNPAQLTSAQQSVVAQIESRLKTLDAHVKAAEDRIRGLFDSLQREVGQAQAQVEEIKRFLERKDGASFPFLAGETVFRADEAEWVNGSDNPDGFLFVTNQRLIFEQHEKTGKKLGLFGGKQVQQMLWEVPLNQVEGTQAENKGVFGGKDMVHLKLNASASQGEITAEVKGGVACKAWVADLGRMIRGEIGAAMMQDPELAERLRSAPTDCPTCGAVLPRAVAGQNSMTCQYCSTVVRL
jgi:hypothetical protein